MAILSAFHSQAQTPAPEGGMEVVKDIEIQSMLDTGNHPVKAYGESRNLRLETKTGWNNREKRECCN